MFDFMDTSKWNSSIKRKICTRWFVNSTEIMLVIYDKDSDLAIDNFSWNKDEFWKKKILELKQYCEDRGDIINGES